MNLLARAYAAAVGRLCFLPLALLALLAAVASCGCSAPMIQKQYDIRVYQYGVGDNNVKSDFLKETSVDPSLNVKR